MLNCYTPGKFNSSPLKMGNPKRKLIFQPSFFRGYVKFRGCNPQHQNNDREAMNPLVIPTASKLACGISLVGRRCSYHVVLWEWRLVLISPTPPRKSGIRLLNVGTIWKGNVAESSSNHYFSGDIMLLLVFTGAVHPMASLGVRKGIFSRIHQRWVRWRSSWKITRIGLRNSPSRK